MFDALGASFVRLINMDALDRSTKNLGYVGWIFSARLATDRMVEDEDLGGTGTVCRMLAASREARWTNKMLLEDQGSSVQKFGERK